MTSTSSSLSRSRSNEPPRDDTVESSHSCRSVSDLRRFRLGRETSGSMSCRFSRLTGWLVEREGCFSELSRLAERSRGLGERIPGDAGERVPCAAVSLFRSPEGPGDRGLLTAGLDRTLSVAQLLEGTHLSSVGEVESGVGAELASAHGSSRSPGLKSATSDMAAGPRYVYGVMK